MRLKSFRIRNFKSIIDTGECNLSENDNVLVLAGQNEAGKSAVIEALNFFRNGPTDKFDRLHRRREENPEIVCKFLLDDDDIKDVILKTENKSLKNDLLKDQAICFVRGDVEQDNFKQIYLTEESRNIFKNYFPDDEIKVLAETENQEPEKVNGVEEGEVDNSNNIEGEETIDDKKNETNQVEEEEEEEEEEEIMSLNKLEKYLSSIIRKFVFYDAFDDLLPGVVAISEINKYPAVLDFEKVFEIDFSEVINKKERAISHQELRLSTNASDDLNKYWTQKLEDGGKYNYKVKISPQKTDINSSTIEFMIYRNDEDPLYMEQKSNGFRWFSAFNLRLRALGVEENTIKNLVILIDEPGQGLHEKAQKDAKNVIEELAGKGAQIIYTTHNPNLIGTEGKEFARIRLVSNSNELGTKVETVAHFASRATQGAKEALSPIITAMGIHCIQSVLDMGRLNVVVEGITDHYYFSAFKKLLKKDERIYFLPACGVNNVPNLVSVLIGWACKYKAVFDDDPKAGRNAYNLLKNEFYEKDDKIAHDHILKIKDCNGIEDIFESKDFYKFVLQESIPRNGPKKNNSQLAQGKKEMLARLFLERAENEDVNLSNGSIKKIEEVFNWIYEKFNLNS